ncbi:MAG: hypothetical protein OQJ84_12480 [Xanthomonadales bacterium]|nr:hypothetical protein [Xanthomonadales bacterium]
MIRTTLRLLTAMVVVLLLSACNKSTKVISEWDAGGNSTDNRERVAVVAMLPEALQRLTAEQEIVEVLRKAGGNALVSSDIPGLSGRLTRATAEPALRAASVDALVVMFLTNAGKGEKLERADYYAVQVDSGFYRGGYGWFTPVYTDVYTIREGSGYYDQERYIYVETTYFDLVEDRAKWSMITRSKDLEYNDTAHSVAKKIVSKMKSTGTL